MNRSLYLLMALLTVAGCHSGHDHAGHGHTVEGQGHDHEGHNHYATETVHSHEAHHHGETIEAGHSHEAHGHSAALGAHDHASHDAHRGHSHDGSDHRHGQSSDGHGYGEAATAHNPLEITFDEARQKMFGVRSEIVSARPFGQIIHVGGSVLPAIGDESIAAAPVSGIITFSGRNLTEGTAVRNGTVIAGISTKGVAGGDVVAKLRAGYEAARKEYERDSAMVKENIVSVSHFEQSKLAYEQARAEYEAVASILQPGGSADRSVEDAESDKPGSRGTQGSRGNQGTQSEESAKHADDVYSRTGGESVRSGREDVGNAGIARTGVGIEGSGEVSVKSPLSGYVKAIYVTSGQFVEAGTAIAAISRNSTLQLRADVPDRYASSLRTITDATFTTAAGETYSVKELGGKVLSYGRVSESGYVPVTFEFPNRVDIVAGTFVDVYLKGSVTTPQIVLPNSAIIEEQGVYSVFVRLSEAGHDHDHGDQDGGHRHGAQDEAGYEDRQGSGSGSEAIHSHNHDGEHGHSHEHGDEHTHSGAWEGEHDHGLHSGRDHAHEATRQGDALHDHGHGETDGHGHAHEAGDCFAKREVRLGASDGVYTVILSGIAEGEDVVVSGAMQIKLASLSAIPSGHNHNH